jgi:hypothetical protein
MEKIRLLFILILAFSSALCFADAKEEEAELNVAILDPIINHFPEDSSYTRMKSKAILKYEKNKKIQFNKKEAYDYIKEKERSGELTSRDSDYDCLWDTLDEIDSTNSDGFAARWGTSWHMNVIQCSGYANLALITFYFNMMNYKIRGEQPMFNGAVFVGARGDTGNHVFILVEGVSGTIFAVDPWIRKVIRLDGFIKLSPLLSNPQGAVYDLKDPYNGLLNHLFSEEGDNGIRYYDALYVNAGTKWFLGVKQSLAIRCMAEMGGLMKTLYEAINVDRRFPRQVPWFPRWQSDYSDLVKPKGGGGCSVQ